jgi:hypothetical protein
MKKWMLTGLAALTVSLAFASGGWHSRSQLLFRQLLRGRRSWKSSAVSFKKVDEATMDVLMQFHKEKLIFSMGDHTKITEADKEVPFTGLKKGMWATLEYRKEGDRLMAETVNVNMPKVMVKKETPSEVKKEIRSKKTPEKM